MKQVVFAVLLIAMATLTGCLNTDDDSSDTTYKPSKNSNISVPFMEFTKTGNTVTSNCKSSYNWQNYNIQFTDTNSNVIWLLDGYRVRDYYDETYYGWEKCEDTSQSKINIILPQEPVRVTVTFFDDDDYHLRTYAGTF